MWHRYRTVVLICVGCLLPAPLLHAATFYVTPNTAAPTGNGSLASPYNSIARALSVARAGDVVRLLPGVYNGPVSFPSGGTAGNPITLRSDGAPRSAVIDCQWATVNCVTADRPNITIDGLEVRNARYNGIKIDGDVNGSNDGREYGNWNNLLASNPDLRRYRVNGSDNITVRNSYIHHICLDGFKIGHVNNVLIEDNEIYKTGMTDPVTGASNQQQGIDLVGAYATTIRRNHIHDDVGASSMEIGLFAKGGSEQILIENNLIENIASPNAAIEVGGDTEDYNTRYTPSAVNAQFHADMLVGASTGYPIGVSGRYVAATMAEARRVIVRGNVIVNADPALSFRNAYDTVAYGNTVIDAGWTQSWAKLWNDGGGLHLCVNVRLYNNAFQNKTIALRVLSGTTGQRYNDRSAGANLVGFVSDYNAFYNRGNPTAAPTDFDASSSDDHSRAIDAQLTAAYYPQAGGPVTTGGANLRELGVLGATESWVDRNGHTRGGDTVVGALAGPPITSPAPPLGVKVR